MDLNHLLNNKKLNSDTEDIEPFIKATFLRENKLLNNAIDTKLSGSTCVSVIYSPEKLIIANIGDSRCVLGKKIIFNNSPTDKGNKNQPSFKYVFENLSRDHKPSLPDESERIKKAGGRIRPMLDDDGKTFIGPLRVYMKDKEMPGLAMTRSFGDAYAATAGTICEPEVTEHIFQEEDKFIILASDGLYEFISSQEVVDYVKDYYEKNDIVGACEFLYSESKRRWLIEDEDNIDDITIIVVFFE
ncbi:MAG: protein phosphatase 2C domain-containing protein [archaeon]|nr:protein phosphatase 2C domain-containing protein [archaeon]